MTTTPEQEAGIEREPTPEEIECVAIALFTDPWVRSSIEGWADTGARIRDELRDRARHTIKVVERLASNRSTEDQRHLLERELPKTWRAAEQIAEGRSVISKEAVPTEVVRELVGALAEAARLCEIFGKACYDRRDGSTGYDFSHVLDVIRPVLARAKAAGAI